MRPKKHKGSNDLFRARLDQIINMKHEFVLLAGKIDWDWIDGEIAPLCSEKGRPGIETRFMIGLRQCGSRRREHDGWRTARPRRGRAPSSSAQTLAKQLIIGSGGAFQSKPPGKSLPFSAFATKIA
ncbi:hypothetical protein ACVWZM_004751 [Bradyrhizobium sp. USDA 4501]